MAKQYLAILNERDYQWAREDIIEAMGWQLEDDADDDTLLDTAYDLAYLHAFATEGFTYSSAAELNELIDRAVEIAKRYAYKDTRFETVTGPLFYIDTGAPYTRVDIYER